jgi:hypothetical protein
MAAQALDPTTVGTIGVFLCTCIGFTGNAASAAYISTSCRYGPSRAYSLGVAPRSRRLRRGRRTTSSAPACRP